MSHADPSARLWMQISLLVGGAYGPLFRRATVAGPRSEGGQTTALRAILGVYPTSDDAGHSWWFIQSVQPIDLTFEQALERTAIYKMAPEDIAAQEIQVAHIGDNKDRANDMLRRAAIKAVNNPQLPWAFIVYRSLPDDRLVEEFWYPRMLPGDHLLRIFMELAARTE